MSAIFRASILVTFKQTTVAPRGRGCAKNPAKRFLVVGSGGIKEAGFA
jgi:hypothetical protein